jgi:hypothetical protein
MADRILNNSLTCQPFYVRINGFRISYKVDIWGKSIIFVAFKPTNLLKP